MVFSISWTLNGNGGNSKSPMWKDVENLLIKLREQSGTLTLDIIDNNDVGSEMLQVRTEDGYYLITLGEYSEDDYEVRSYWHPTQLDDQVKILGDYWPARQLTKDFYFVVRVFKEFFDTGDVSKDLLN